VEKANLCKCGCGQPVKEEKRFIRGHNLRINNPMKFPEITKKVSHAKKGRTYDQLFGERAEEEKRKRSHIAWNKGLTKNDERILRSTLKRSMTLIRKGVFKGEKNPFYGKHHTEDSRRKIREALEISGANQRASERMKKNHPMNNPKVWRRFLNIMRSVEYRQKISSIKRDQLKSREYLKRLSEAAKINWRSPAFVKRWAKACWKRPTSLEERMMKILDEYFPGKYSYTGDGKDGIIIGTMIPDFVRNDGKAVIEVFGSFWHHKKDEKERITAFQKFGYRCLVIWEQELENKAAVIDKISRWEDEQEISRLL
jgi:G:T-mismatch repair DNA endonuclease (very short patch repair protein)